MVIANSPFEVPRGRLTSPFHECLKANDLLNEWHQWNGYTVPNALFDAELEYFAIRNAAAVFDLSPMCKYRIIGDDAEAFVNRLVTRDMSRVVPGQVAYVAWCDEQGQLLDDGTVFHLAPGEYRLCAQERQYDWLIDSSLGFDVRIVDETADVAALALQGPTSYSVLKALGIPDLDELRPFRSMEVTFGNSQLLVSRTGFTGDLGYELWIEPAAATALWDALFEAGRVYGIRPMGGDALQLARVEAGFIQAGVDFLPAKSVVRTGRTRSPLELGLDWLVDFGKANFNGRRALAEEYRNGSRWRFARLDIEGNKPAVNAYVFGNRRGKGGSIGFTTSAVWSPVCKKNIALASVDARYGKPGDRLWVEIYYQREMHWSRVMAEAQVVEGPFLSPSRRSATPPAPC